MKMQKSGKWWRLLVASLAALSLTLAGCSGDDGDDGLPGAPGAPGSSLVDVGRSTPDELAALTVTAEITSVTIASAPVVKFKVTDNLGRGVTGLNALRAQGDLAYTRFNIVKLVPGTNGNPDRWVNYIRNADSQPTTERNGTLVDHGDGTYTYTFNTNVSTVTTPVAVSYQPTLTHRVAIQISGAGFSPVNPTFDFVPAGGAVTTMRNIAMTASCNECHGQLRIHGSRIEVKYCVTCHNPDLVDDAGNSGDMTLMVHKIHMGAHLANGYVLGGNDYSAVQYPANNFSSPEGLNNCRKCHTAADAATPQGDNWKSKPYIEACGACHDDVDFATHPGTNNSTCSGCHNATTTEEFFNIDATHRTVVSTENNPEVPSWAKILQYEIASFSFNDTTNVATVRFRVLAKQLSTDVFTPVDLNNLASVSATAQNLSFRLIWAAPQGMPPIALDGPAIGMPADWNNAFGAGRSYFVGSTDTTLDAFDQPISVNLSTVLATLTPDAQGFYTADLAYTLSPEADAAVAAATMRAIGLEGGLTVVNPNTAANVLLLGKSLIVGEGVTDTPRRKVVDIARCNQCHEWLGFHGSQSRNNNPDYCVACHNTEMTNSGRSVPPDTTYGEFSNNLKDMIHAIHGAQKRTTPFAFVRGSISATTGGQGIHDFSHVDFFDRANECDVCHSPDTYLPEAVPMSALWSTVVATPTAAVADFDPTLNERLAPTTAACFACHDSQQALNHMSVNTLFGQGGIWAETCVTCHASGAAADIDLVHGN